MAFEPGQTGNAGGRPKGTGKPVSRLRQLEKQLKTLTDTSLKLIAQELDFGVGKPDVKPVDKEALSTAKWTVTTYTAVRKAAEAEEQSKLVPGAPVANETGSGGSDSEGGPATFTLKVVG